MGGTPHPLGVRRQTPESRAVPEDYWDLQESTRTVAAGQPKVQAILEWIGTGLVVDIGCNDGAIARLIQERGERVVGADRLRYAEVAFRTVGIPVVALNAEQSLPFADGSFDGVLISGVLEYVAAPAALLREARRIMASGGRLVLVAPNRNAVRRIFRRWRDPRSIEAGGFEFSALQAMVRQAGFSIRAFRPCPYKGENWRGRLAYWFERVLPGHLATDFAFLCEAS